MHANELIGPRIIAAAGQIHYETVLRWRREGKLPPYDVAVGRKLRGWKLDTLKAHAPQIAILTESYIRNQEVGP